MEQTDNGYSIKTQSTKGLSTFVLTLSISLIVFSAIYYFMTTKTSTSEYDDFRVGVVEENGFEEEPVSQPISDSTQEQPVNDTSVFGKLASASPDSNSGQVLAGTDTAGSEVSEMPTEVPETTQSNLETGVTSITFGLISALALFISGMVFIHKGPRKAALSTFEKNITGRI